MTESPPQLAEHLLGLASDYSRLSDELAEVLTAKPMKWIELRAVASSDTQAERAWSATEDGVKEVVLRLKVKALEKVMSAIKTRLRVLEGEANNLY